MPDRCPACHEAVEWVDDGAQTVPVDPGTRVAVMPGRGQFAVYDADGRPIVGRRVSHRADRGAPGVRWGRTLHWATCEAAGAYEKAVAAGSERS